jgi:hypothetical protein
MLPVTDYTVLVTCGPLALLARVGQRIDVPYPAPGVSLAAPAIPLRRAGGSSFPDREIVTLVVAAVILATLRLRGVSLPWLLGRLGLDAGDTRTEERRARLKSARAALKWLVDQSGGQDGAGTDAAAA